MTSSRKRFSSDSVFFLNPKSCGVYKNGGARYKVDLYGRRTNQIDNELIDQVLAFIGDDIPDGASVAKLASGSEAPLLIPRYHDMRWDAPFEALKAEKGLNGITLGELIDQGILTVRGGHGSPSNDQRIGSIPYIKVSDIRNLRLNVNPTNLVPLRLAKQMWGGLESGIRPWDLITPNRASSNIGEFAMILPGEERVLITKEVFVIRVVGGAAEGYSPFYLLWALCLKAVRLQWQRLTFMQTNREDVGARFREVRIPKPMSREWAEESSGAFRRYFESVADAKTDFLAAVSADSLEYIASVFSRTAVETPDELAEQAAEVTSKGVRGRRKRHELDTAGDNDDATDLPVIDDIVDSAHLAERPKARFTRSRGRGRAPMDDRIARIRALRHSAKE